MAWLQSFFGSKTKSNIGVIAASPIDVVVYLASLASNPQSIGPILDPLRNITANLGPDRVLSEKDQVTLARVYKELMIHLTTNEPAQVFTKEVLEEKIRTTFAPERVTNEVFWDELAKT